MNWEEFSKLDKQSAAGWLLDHYFEPLEVAELAAQKRRALQISDVQIYGWPAVSTDTSPLPFYDWSSEEALPSYACVQIVCEEATQRSGFVDWLQRRSEDSPKLRRLAPVGAQASSTQRTWLCATSRILLPAEVRVEARFDHLGSRIAQLTLNFGADAIAGPIQASRNLPIAGVSRPTENTIEALRELVEQVGCSPRIYPMYPSEHALYEAPLKDEIHHAHAQ